MSDLSNEVTKRVEAARNFEKHRERTLEEQVSARSHELCVAVHKKFKEAAEASNGAMTYHWPYGYGDWRRPPEIKDRIELTWWDPLPARSLTVILKDGDRLVHRFDCDELGLHTGWRKFDLTRLDDLILELATQERWLQR